MSAVSLKLVQNRQRVGAADDLAVSLLLSFTGLLVQLVIICAGVTGIV